MNYQDILNRITDNLGIAALSSRQISTIRRDIFDVIGTISRKAESNRQLYEFTVDKDEDDNTYPTSQTLVPSNFYAPLEVIFRAGTGNMIMSKEVTWETYMRWSPNEELVTTSFVEMVSSASPQTIMWSQENEDLDGCVAFTFLDIEPIKMVWKPAVEATVQLLYIAKPTFPVDALTETPAMHPAFHEAIVDGVMQKILIRKLREVQNEVEFLGIRTMLKEFGDKYKEAITDYAGFVNKTTDVHSAEPFDFLNDPHMRIYR